MNEDIKQIGLLSKFHYVVAGLAYLFSLFPMIHVVIGWAALFYPETLTGNGGKGPPPFFGWIFLITGLTFVLAGFAFATLIVISGRKLSKLKNYWFSFIMACVECMFMPFGTILGIFTIVVLSRDSVKTLYAAREQPDALRGP